MRILINTPRLIPQGGVANHYLGLWNYWTEHVIYNPIGKKGNKIGSGIYRLPINILTFIRKILFFHPDVVLLNPSLSKSAVVRDMLFLKVAKFFNKKVVVFFHGFDKKCIPTLNILSLVKDLNKCECIFLLANEFKEILRSWGVKTPIYLTTTKVDDELVKDFDISCRAGKIETILFLARITEEKGIFIALKAFKICTMAHPNLKMRVVGDGPALENAKKMCEIENIQNVIFLGALSGEKLTSEYKKAELYLFPTYHAEGMPTSVLEAMAFGLPVVTRSVGGLSDFFENGKMGDMTDSLSPQDFANAVIPYIEDAQLTRTVSLHNYNYALSHFMASMVAKNIERELIKII